MKLLALLALSALSLPAFAQTTDTWEPRRGGVGGGCTIGVDCLAKTLSTSGTITSGTGSNSGLTLGTATGLTAVSLTAVSSNTNESIAITPKGTGSVTTAGADLLAGNIYASGSNFISSYASGPALLSGSMPDGASAVGVAFDTQAGAYTSAGAKIASFRNNAVEKNFMWVDGSLRQTPIAAASLPTCSSTLEGLVEKVVAASSVPTKECVCVSDGAGSPAFAWRNTSTNALGTSTTCPANTSWSATYRATLTVPTALLATVTCSKTAVTVTGAAVGAECSVGQPSTIEAGLTGTCFVSATNTAQYQLCNSTGSSITPAGSQTASVRVFNP